MFRTILPFGVAAGLIVAVPMFSALVYEPSPEATTSSQLFGYSIMVVALSLIFIAVKRYRDRELGGIIKFLPAFLVGLGVSAVAAVVYVVGWEITLRLTNFGFVESYATGMVDAVRNKGGSQAEIEKAIVDMANFRQMYANPLMRLPITFIEIFPVGVVISLISAALLRNHRFLPARAPQAA